MPTRSAETHSEQPPTWEIDIFDVRYVLPAGRIRLAASYDVADLVEDCCVGIHDVAPDGLPG